MLRNYIKTALRNLARRKGNAIVNIAGLMVGFAAILLIFLVIQYEQSFDNFHQKKDRIYRVVRIGRNPVNREYRTGVPIPVTAALRTDFPQLANAAAISPDWNVQVIITSPGGAIVKKIREASGVFFAEPQFFSMFDFSLAAGDIKNAINEPNTALLTKDIATKYFGDWQKAMGKTIRMDGLSIRITGILNNVPSNTDFPIKAILSYSTMRNYMDITSWGNINDGNYCFVQLGDEHSQEQFSKLLDHFVDQRIKPVNPGYMLGLQPLSEIHYDDRYGNYRNRTFSKDLIFALSLIGLFLLIIACVNFINLTTAQAVNRSKEVGVRKVLGGGRGQLVTQFLGETGIISLFALLGSILIVLICIPFLNDLLDIHLSTSILYSGKVLLFMLCAVLMVAFLSGFYPALVLSGFKSINVLKGGMGVGRQKGIYLRRGLVVFQFVIAQGLVIATLVVASQMDYFRTADMGFRKEAIVNADILNDSLGLTRMDALRADLLGVSGIENISISMGTPTGGGWYTDLRLPTNQSSSPDMVIDIKPADTSYFRLYDLTLTAGRVYYPSDTIHEFVVNQTVVRRLGIQHDEAAIGKQINVNGRTFPIVGVVRDFHVNSLRDPIGPVVMTTIKNAYGLVSVKINLSQTKTVLNRMENIWNKYFPNYTFEYRFLDQTVADFYQQENQLSILYKVFSGIAIFISCLGLYGLISFMAVQRKKEIGIRKVLGAPVRDIVIMLSREFTLLITIAFLIATPLAWYFMHQWLQQYTYRIIIGIWFFGATIAGSLFIAWMTVGYTAIRAALANPVKSLRTE